MALADIIARIGSDAEAEAEAIIAEADAEARRILEEARVRAGSTAAAILDREAKRAAADAATLLANARLSARDEALAARGALIEEGIQALIAGIETLEPKRYVRFVARRIASSARSGDVVSLAAADAHLSDDIRREAAEAPGVDLVWSEEVADVERGAVITGQRTRVEVTPRAVVEEERAAIELSLARALFNRKGA